MTIASKPSVNKKTIAATLILALLFSAAVVLQSVSLALANPGPYPDRPIPNTTPPILTVQSPLNTIYYENDIPLNLTVTIPQDWTQYESVRSVSYQLDGQGFTFTLWDGWHTTVYGNNVVNYSLPPTQQFSTVLKGLFRGQHVLQINVNAQSDYWPNPNFFFPSHYPLDTSQTILFTVDAGPFPSPSPTPSPSQSPSLSLTPTLPPSSSLSLSQSPSPSQSPSSSQEIELQPEPFPIALVVASVASVAVVCTSLVIYFKKRNSSG